MLKMSIPLIMFVWFSSVCYGQHEGVRNGQAAQEIDKDRDRWLWQLPGRVIDELRITEGMVVADVGAGEGYFTIPLARRVGATGRVFASDIDQQALNILKARSDQVGLMNIQLVLGTENDPKLPPGQFDRVIIVNTIHLIDDLNSLLDHVKESLKQSGTLVIIQWDSEKMSTEAGGEWAAEDKAKFSLRTTLRRIYAAGFEVEKILTFLPVQTIVVCVPGDR